MSESQKPGAARAGDRDPGRPGPARGPVRDRAPRGADLHAVPGRRTRARHHVPVPVRRVQPEAVAKTRASPQKKQQAVQRWRKQISHVATQEMLHLSLVQNLLSAIGGAPHLSRPNFPHPASHYPAGVHLALMPFGDQALRHFMFLERPEGMDLNDAEGMAAFGRALPAMQAGDIVPRGQDFATVGHLYRSIEAGHRAPGRQVRRAVAVRRPAAGPGHPAALRLARADRGDRRGLGAAGHRRDPGAGRGPARALAGRALRPVRRRSWTSTCSSARPTRPSTRSARWSRSTSGPAERDTDVPLVTDPLTRAGHGPVQRLLRDPAAACCSASSRTPRRPTPSSRRWPTRASTLMFEVPSSRSATWSPRSRRARSTRAARPGPASSCSTSPTTCCRTARRPGSCSPSASARPPSSASPAPPAAPAVADGLAAVRSGLTEIADALAAHLPARGPPAAKPRLRPRTSPPCWPAPKISTERAWPFTRHDDPALSGLAALLGSAYQVVRAQPGRRPHGRPPGQQRPAPASRRPARTRRTAKPQKPQTAPSTPRAPRISGACAVSLGLAHPATTLRARLGASAPPGLLEAAAALQDLAVARCPPASGPRRIAELAGPAARPAARDHDRQERPLPGHQRPAPCAPRSARRCTLPPQLALCRCGASSHEAVLRRDARQQRVHRRQGPEPGARPARHLPGAAGHDLRQPGHLPALRPVHRPAGHRVPHRHRAVRRARAAAGWTRSSGRCATARPGR